MNFESFTFDILQRKNQSFLEELKNISYHFMNQIQSNTDLILFVSIHTSVKLRRILFAHPVNFLKRLPSIENFRKLSADQLVTSLFTDYGS